MSDISMIKCPKCKAEYQNFLATQLKGELAAVKKEAETHRLNANGLENGQALLEQKLFDTNIKWAVEVKKLIGELAAAKQTIKVLEFANKDFSKENKRLEEALEKIKVNSYPGLAVKESTLLNRIYRLAEQALNPKEKPK